MAKEKWLLSGKLFVDANSENIVFLKTPDFLEIRQWGGLRDILGYMIKNYAWVAITQGKDGELLQNFFRNSDSLVQKQIRVYQGLWKIAIPLSSRTK